MGMQTIPPAKSAINVVGKVESGRNFIMVSVTAPASAAEPIARGKVFPKRNKPVKRRFKMTRRIMAWVVKVNAAESGIPAKPITGERIEDNVTKATT